MVQEIAERGETTSWSGRVPADDHRVTDPSTGAEIDGGNCVQILNNYVRCLHSLFFLVVMLVYV